MKNAGDFKYLFENHPEFSPLPTFFVLPGRIFFRTVEINGKEYDVSAGEVLHAEHYFEVLHDDLPTEGELITTGSIIDISDKRSGALVWNKSKYLSIFIKMWLVIEFII